jgi:hypothetical protein
MAPRNFGLTPRERSFLARLSPPWRIQRFLDGLDYDTKGEGCRSARRVLAERKVQCMDGALFAAAALRVQGYPPLIVDLEAVYDDDHVLAVFRNDGHWGAIARSNYSGLRFREPIHPTIRSLVLSYFESYFNLRREKTLRRYSRPVNLSRFDRIAWMTTEEDLWEISDYLYEIPHRQVLEPRAEKSLSTVDWRVFEAGLVGRVGPRPGGRGVPGVVGHSSGRGTRHAAGPPAANPLPYER